MNQALSQRSVRSGITQKITSLSFYCSFSCSSRWGQERRDDPLKAYISVDEEINQIISRLRKGTQRGLLGHPSLTCKWNGGTERGPGVRCKEGKRDGA